MLWLIFTLFTVHCLVLSFLTKTLFGIQKYIICYVCTLTTWKYTLYVYLFTDFKLLEFIDTQGNCVFNVLLGTKLTKPFILQFYEI